MCAAACLLLIGSSAAAGDCRERRPCGPAYLGPLKLAVPQGFLGADFRPACRAHDHCYQTRCARRRHCDRSLRRRLFRACDCSRCRIGCRIVAGTMYVTTRVLGFLSFAD